MYRVAGMLASLNAVHGRDWRWLETPRPLVEQALAKGESVERRSNAPAWAILGVKIAQAKLAPAPVEKQTKVVRAVA
jgi:hypothetical protein